MTATVRCFSFTGTMGAPRASGSKVYATDSVSLLKYPYSAREALVATDSAAQSTSADLTPDGVEMLLVQVESGKAVFIEVNPPNRSVAADTSSPLITGDQLFRIGRGWTFSFLEHEIT